MSDVITAISTAMGEAGIGIVRMSGKDSLNIGEKLFHPIKHKGLDNIKNKTNGVENYEN